MQNYLNQQQINDILALTLKAGQIAIDAFLHKNFEIFAKKDHSKVSSADIAISKLIGAELQKICPNIPIICEENDLRDVDNQLFFLIDPIDGTSSFINNSEEFCINIALINRDKPVFGIIYAPLYEGGKAIYCDSENQVIVYNHQQKIYKKIEYNKISSKTLKIITSSRTKDEDINNFIAQFFPNFVDNYSVQKLSSAIKFFKIIEGKSNLYLHFRKSMEWDTASGHAILNSAGLNLKTLEYRDSFFSLGDELLYKKNHFINDKFVVIAL